MNCTLSFEEHPQFGRRVVSVTGLGGLWVPKTDVWITGMDRCEIGRKSGDFESKRLAQLRVFTPRPNGGTGEVQYHTLERVRSMDDRPDFVDLRKLLLRLLSQEEPAGYVALNDRLLTVVASIDLSDVELELLEQLVVPGA